MTDDVRHMYQNGATLCGAPLGDDVEWLGLTSVTCEGCRAAMLADKCAPQGWDPWNNPMDRAAHERLEASVSRDLAELKALAGLAR